MKRIATSMLGGIGAALLMVVLIVFSPVFAIWKARGVRERRTGLEDWAMTSGLAAPKGDKA